MWTVSCLRPANKIVIELDGIEYQSHTIKGIIAQYINDPRMDGTLPESDIVDKVMSAMAEKYPKYVKWKKEKDPNAPKIISIYQALSFARFAAKRIADGSVVSTEEANRRADICRKCPLANNVGACTVCKQALKTLVKVPEIENMPEGCSVCGCYLPLKVWVPGDQLKGYGDLKYHSECWMLSLNSESYSQSGIS